LRNTGKDHTKKEKNQNPFHHEITRHS
jgi:hypothetical protein